MSSRPVQSLLVCCSVVERKDEKENLSPRCDSPINLFTCQTGGCHCVYADCFTGLCNGAVRLSISLKFKLEMCRNGFQHSHSLPFPPIQFPFPPIPIPNYLIYSHSHGIPVWAIPIPPIPILLMLKLYIISDTVIIIIRS